MPQLRSQKALQSNDRHYTPPPELADYNGHAKTPQRSAVFALRAFAKRRRIKITRKEIEEITGVATRVQSRILASKQLRTLHNTTDQGPDPQGRKKALKRSETAAISMYLEDDSIPLDQRGAPWPEVAKSAGISIPTTYHFKSNSYEPLTSYTIRKSCRIDEDIMNAVCEEEKELGKTQATNRLTFVDIQLKLRPKSTDWFDVCFCDEFHLGIGPQITKRVKRKRGKASREARRNVHLKKVTSKDTKAKAREEEALPLLNMFVIIGRNYRRFIPYKMPSNQVGKMSTKVYTTEILPQVKQDLLDRDLTLWQDKDSAHNSKGAKAWFEKNGVPYITSPGNSPDFSIFESYAYSLKTQFYKEPCTTQKQALARFEVIFDTQFDQKVIDNMYIKYTKRLYDCRRREGQMTKY